MNTGRYAYTKTKKNDNGKSVKESLSFINIEPKDTDVYIITTATDRLDLLSNSFYQTPKYWWVIAMVNDINTGTMVLEPNLRLFIPTDIADVLTKLKEANQ